MRVTLDSNVYVSALNFGGLPAELLELAAQGVFQIQLSPPILEETSRILREKFHWPIDDLMEARGTLQAISQRVIPHLWLKVCRDPDDDRILECSQASRSDYIVTSDKDLLDLKQYAGARIVKPPDLLTLLVQRGR